MIRFIIHRLKKKGKIPTTELIEQKALERVMPLAQEMTRQVICRDCLDKRCLNDTECKAFDDWNRTYAWSIMARNAELN